ncbi:myosin heavy chain, clone 203-like [Gossypium hirsutum]|uniref:Myosin heavy chain, clone 203-like n=1 Tax=Gossypium hirsutum TaxID=3635 RepID=A0A1U8PNM5_GOSHI|nr:myosin heavy chain, clone 203-like [Gossypium hirsutum]
MVTPEYNGWFRKRVNDNIPRPSLEDTRPVVEQLQEIREEKTKADRWERKFREAQARNEDIEKSLSESRNERGELRARVAELEKSLHQYRSRKTGIELRASLSKVEEMIGKVEELEASLQSCEMQIQFFEASKKRWKEQLHHAQDQVRNMDYIMGEAVT